MSETTPTPAAAPVTRTMADPAKVFYRVPFSRTIRPALVAIAIAWVLVIAIHLLYLVRDLLWIASDGAEYLPDALGDFGAGAILNPLLFFAGAGVLIVLVLPIVAETKLLTVMIRAAIAGIGGFVLLTVKGLIEAIIDAVTYGLPFGYFVNTWIGYPLVIAFDLVALLVIGAVVSWLMASRKAVSAA